MRNGRGNQEGGRESKGNSTAKGPSSSERARPRAIEVVTREIYSVTGFKCDTAEPAYNYIL